MCTLGHVTLKIYRIEATEQEESPEMGGFTVKFDTSVVPLPKKKRTQGINPPAVLILFPASTLKSCSPRSSG